MSMALSWSPLLPILKTFHSALANPNWWAAMEEEHTTLLKKTTWDLILHTSRTNVGFSMWIFKHKLETDCSLERYKAHWVVHGFIQRPGIDFDETFSSTVKPAMVRLVLPLALARC